MGIVRVELQRQSGFDLKFGEPLFLAESLKQCPAGNNTPGLDGESTTENVNGGASVAAAGERQPQPKHDGERSWLNAEIRAVLPCRADEVAGGKEQICDGYPRAGRLRR